MPELNIALKPVSIAAFNTARLPGDTLPAMHETARRLYEAASLLAKTNGQSAVAKLLNESPQTLNNWEKRGVSWEGAVKAERDIGCRAAWLQFGDGEMTSRTPAAAEPAAAYRVPSLEESARTVLAAIAQLPPMRWAAVRGALDQLVGHPEMLDDAVAELLPRLTAHHAWETPGGGVSAGQVYRLPSRRPGPQRPAGGYLQDLTSPKGAKPRGDVVDIRGLWGLFNS